MISVYQYLKRIKSSLDKEAFNQPGAAVEAPPARSVLDDCIETMVRCSVLKPDEKEVMKEALRGTPPSALTCMTVLAKHADQQAMVAEPFGEPVPSESPVPADPKKKALERYREASRRLN